MNRHEKTEQQIRTAMEHAAPDVLEQILSSCDTQKGEIVTMTKTKKRNHFAAWTAAAACLVLICTGVFGLHNWRITNTVSSTILFDVNPSISLQVNARERVLEVTALNQDAEVILDNMDLKGTDLNVAVNAIIGSMLQKGYLSDLQNSILVSVENQDAAKSSELQSRITETINALCQTESWKAAVVTQTVTEDSELERFAKEYGISVGKAQLIQELIRRDNTLTVASLAPLSVNEIMLIAESRKLDNSFATTTGSASEKAYIGADAAKQIAFEHACVKEDSVSNLEIELDSEDGQMVYELEFDVGSTEYDYDINALDGTIVKNSVKAHENNVGNSITEDSRNFIGKEAAQKAALSDAGVTESSVKYCSAWIEYDDGRPEHYEVKFEANGTCYVYEIGLTDGSILERKQEYHYHHDDNSQGSWENAGDFIGEEAAKNVAFAHAGVTETAVMELECKLDEDDGRYVYEIEFEAGNLEYEYEIDAATGDILSVDIDD